MYVFRTRLPVAINRIATVMLPLDLHVLSLPLAFILSQDQTLHCKRFDLTINLIKINVGYNLLLRLYLTINIAIYSTVTFHLFKDLKLQI